MSPGKCWRLLGLIVLVAAAARIGHIAAIRGTPLWHFGDGWTTSDMYVNLNWADHIAAGDWLDRETFRPRFAWQDGVAPPEVWLRWLGPTTYYQPPLYTYLLALVIRATGSPDLFRVLQALLGAVNVGLVGLLGWRLATPWAGLAAAAFAAIYAPWILYDAELLRGTLAITSALACLLALRGADGPAAAGAAGWRRWRGWLLAGLLLGAGYLADSSIVTFIPLAALWALLGRSAVPQEGDTPRAPRGEPGLAARLKEGAPRVGALAAGMLAALIPLLARNLAVGAPPFAVTTRAPLAFVMGNAPDAMPVGALIPESTGKILNASQYRVVPTILETYAAHGGDLGGLLSLQLRKLVGIFNSHEVPDNPSFYYAELRSPVLRFGLRFSCVVGLGLVGMLLAARRQGSFLLLYLHAASVLALFLTAQVVSRYRQPLLIALFIFAGLAVTEALRQIRVRPAPAAATLLGAAALSFAMPSGPPPGYRVHRAAEFMAAAAWLEERGDPRAAGEEVRRAIDFSWKEAGPVEERVMLGLELGSLYIRNDMYPQALSALRDVIEESPEQPAALATIGAIHQDMNQPWQALQYLLQAVRADPGNPEVHARLGHLYWFVFEAPSQAAGHLRRALEIAPDAPLAPRIRELLSVAAAAAASAPPAAPGRGPS